jgi:hypothetical protein
MTSRAILAIAVAGVLRRRLMAARLLPALLLACLTPSVLLADFTRGDADGDGKVDISDAVAFLSSMFRAGAPFSCEDAADANDDGKLNIGDALATLTHLFAGGSLPNPGALASGPDPTCDRLDCASSPDLTPAVVLSEIQYHPIGDFSSYEYVEVHNRTPGDVSLAGYRFANGIEFAFPEDAVLPAGGYAVVFKDPGNARWRRVPGLKLGPFDGVLSDGGERLTLTDGACAGETAEYGDGPPWPVGPDGGGPSLERIDELADPDDFRAWRTSTAGLGTPGESNSTAGTPVRPAVIEASFHPGRPTSADSVTVRVTMDAAAEDVVGATLHWEALAASVSEPGAAPMSPEGGGPDFSSFTAVIPAQPSQTLVRMDVEVELVDGRRALLPQPGEPRAFLSYFVHDGETPAALPILWLFPRRRTGLPIPSRVVSAVVILPPSGAAGAGEPLVFDGAQVSSSRQGQKIKFLKGEEHRGDRTLNMVPEEGGGGTGLLAPHMEHLGFEMFRALGAIAPRADWFRVVDYSSVARRHTQRLLIQGIGERFLELNGLDPGGDLYKYVYQGLEKHTNLETGSGTLNVLLSKLRSADPAVRGRAVHDELDVDSVGLYSIAGVLIANWDGFHNNIYIYNDLSPGGRWKVFPWDLDQVFETSCAEMPVARPLTGEGCNSREPGVISRPFHLEPDLDAAYRDGLRAMIAPGAPFSQEAVIARIDAVEALLLEDLALAESSLGIDRGGRRIQVKNAYAAMRTYVRRRIPYLAEALSR